MYVRVLNAAEAVQYEIITSINKSLPVNYKTVLNDNVNPKYEEPKSPISWKIGPVPRCHNCHCLHM